jgi:hypothetical protein
MEDPDGAGAGPVRHDPGPPRPPCDAGLGPGPPRPR